MKYKQLLGACAVIAVLLSGCGTQSDGKAAASANAAGATASASQNKDQAQDQKQGQQDKQQRGAMTEGQREMMMTFSSLIRMDKADGLAITKEQAEQMLPVVQDSISKGEVSADTKTKLTEKLTAEQKKFLDDQAANASQVRPGGNKGDNANKPELTDEQKQKMEEARQKREQQKTDASGASGANADSGANANGGDQYGKDKQPRNGGGFNPGGGKNIGDQLVELLQSKTK
ncbi:hypothetical protein SK3146_03191 [Paenibacillus konkukensis]|uniref:Lipoprotein n=1 Tax=Paenibacillus konkukensis TaxID=2020716 RepID=A0ABY4RNE0_9BACL|nr:hypothetical protein [Paenibacillus konkukensis]UQZ83979.1 hypothetical protein SK3146_03191 [Paenibacillus konkukensis]